MVLGNDVVNKIELAGRTAVVTGGATGIGFAERLKVSGAVVELWDRDREGLAAAADRLGAGARIAVVDLADAAAVQRAADEALAGMGRIDLLCADARIAGPDHPSREHAREAWCECVDIDIDAAF